jgi:hypothetical protein
MKSSCHFLFNHLGLLTPQNSTQFSNSICPVFVVLEYVLINATKRLPLYRRGTDHAENSSSIVTWRGTHKKTALTLLRGADLTNSANSHTNFDSSHSSLKFLVNHFSLRRMFSGIN